MWFLKKIKSKWIFCAYNLDFIQDAHVHCRARNRPEQRPLSFPSISFLGELGCSFSFPFIQNSPEPGSWTKLLVLDGPWRETVKVFVSLCFHATNRCLICDSERTEPRRLKEVR